MSDAANPSAWQRLLARGGAARWSLVLLVLVVLAAVFGPMLMSGMAGEVSADQFAAPSWAHPFGTDLHGQDMLFRVLSGARVSLAVGIAGALIAFFIGTAYGLVAGYAGGKTDGAMMRFVEILYAVPRLIILLIAINAFDSRMKMWLAGIPGLVSYSRIVILILSLGLIEWLTMARIVRGQVLALKSQQFVLAARSLGQTHWKILTRHLLPNLVGVVIVYLTLTVPAVILDESFLSFLGLGIQAPQASWGSLLADGAQAINPVKSYWWLLAFPAATMSLTLLALNFLGDALRDVLDPRAEK
ncbi:MAG: ABC transporter permease [Verrucomicrobia bacterium]|nr:ABC transporter permease [Verrucomicrobiota bacterium]